MSSRPSAVRRRRSLHPVPPFCEEPQPSARSRLPAAGAPAAGAPAAGAPAAVRPECPACSRGANTRGRARHASERAHVGAPAIGCSGRAVSPSAHSPAPPVAARGVPAAIYSPRTVEAVERPVTSPRPFKLQGEARHAVAKEAHARQLQEAAERERKEREFKAKPMRVGEAWAPKLDGHVTESSPFQLTSDARGAAYAERMASQRAELEATERREREFHARPANVVTASPFVTRKSDKPLTEIKSFAINTDARSEKRKVCSRGRCPAAPRPMPRRTSPDAPPHRAPRCAIGLDCCGLIPPCLRISAGDARCNRRCNGTRPSARLHTGHPSPPLSQELEEANARRRAEKEQEAAKAAAAKQMKEAAELAQLRKQMVHKARPANVLKSAPFQLQKTPRPTTKAASPNLSTKARGATRIVTVA